MFNHRRKLRSAVLHTFLPAAAVLAAHAAFASDPLPGDLVAPPVGVNIGMLYNEFSDAGADGALRGGTYSRDTHISTEITVGRLIHIFSLGGMTAGVQVYEPYVAFLGNQEVGVTNIAGPDVPALGGQLPSYGPGRADLSKTSGFAQPNFSVFFFPINDPATGSYAVVAPWVAPPVSSFNKNTNLNPSANTWVYEIELGYRRILFGTPTTPNLQVELWSSSYGFGDNSNSAYVTPTVNANSIPPIYGVYHALSGGLIPDSNPLEAASSTPATFHEQPSEEFRLYLPYEVIPAIDAFIVPGFYQSLGGKQTYKLRDGAKIDSGNRTEESQLRLIAETFVSPTLQLMAIGEYDVANHGGALDRNFEIRIAKFF